MTMTETGTRIDEIAAGIYRISTPVPPEAMPGGFTFNQFLVDAEEPLLFHTGMRSLFPAVREAVTRVLGDPARLRWVGSSHFEADECGALNEWLAVAPNASALCSQVGALTSLNDFSLRPPRPLADGEALSLGGEKRVVWVDAPNLPHNWECGYLFESSTRTLLCGDLFTHAGHEVRPLTESDVLGPAEAMRKALPASVAVERGTRALLEKLAATEPTTLAIMHGSSFRGDGGKLLRGFADALGV